VAELLAKAELTAGQATALTTLATALRQGLQF
jgi:hypothetical protein